VTNGAIKRRARDWMAARGEPILVRPGEKALQTIESEYMDDDNATQRENLQQFIDVRLFGHVPTAGDNHNPIWGPVQIADAVSVDPVDIETMAITRSLPTKEDDDGKGMGRRSVVRYGLYRAIGSYAPNRALDSVTEDDLKLLYESLLRGFEHAASASRPQVEGRLLAVVTHENELGNAPRSATTDLVEFNANGDRPRAFDDYTRTVHEAPSGTELSLFEPYDFS
jgi:CRISPR-associated protein Csd2